MLEAALLSKSRPMTVLGIGTDIIECLRIAKMIERHGELFLTRVYTSHEIEYCTARKASSGLPGSFSAAAPSAFSRERWSG